MVVVFAVVAALSYGVADFVGGFGSRRTSPWSVALMAQIGSTAFVLALSPLVGGTMTGQDAAWAVAAGIANGLGTVFLYRGLSTGRMGVVAPVSGVGAAALPVMAGVALGERPSMVVWTGIAMALPGIWWVSRESADVGTVGGDSPTRSGLIDGVLAGLGFGGLFVCLDQIADSAGVLPLAVNQAVAGVVIVAIAVVTRRPWVPRERPALLGLVAGALAGLATAAFLAATRTGYLAVAAVVTSLYPGVTVLLAASLLRERLNGPQRLGLVLCLAAIVLVAAPTQSR